ncbi:Uncharacterized protein TCAP_05454 [Tolypocladium capitatum]|uniref:Uncharacterized protein n=1 Tax=Tolypocladium capitatum TaxID=45235 RepID=A0A2K3QAL9_9HYPO|nr:Uncharacterized protein TCAP_05454 [Tolypocladium capitatum]
MPSTRSSSSADKPTGRLRGQTPSYSPLFKFVMKYVPLAMRIYRAKLFWEKERDFAGFDLVTGADTRKNWTAETTDYIRKNSPANYRDFLVPKSEIGCKRRVNDTDYLLNLHRPNVELIYEDPVQEIVEDGVRTKSGRVVPADAIVLAHGFETQKFLFPMKIYGENGIDLYEHWNRVSEGVPSSYLGTCIAGFPNFFIMMVYLFSGALLTSWPKPSAEARDIAVVQEKAKKFVWASGCTSWFIEPNTKRNSVMFPDWQYRFWLRTVFVAWNDFSYTQSRDGAADAKKLDPGAGSLIALVLSLAICASAWALESFDLESQDEGQQRNTIRPDHRALTEVINSTGYHALCAMLEVP